MKRVIFYVEGQTEEIFVKRVLQPHFEPLDIFVEPRMEGGVVSYEKTKRNINKFLNDKNLSLLTTMFDFYGLHATFPKNKAGKTPLEKVQNLEKRLATDIESQRFLPYFSLHEFEAFLFVDPNATANVLGKPELKESINAMKKAFSSPEHINDHPESAPSKRILSLYPPFRKTIDGIRIVQTLDLSVIRQSCEHFHAWLSGIERTSGGGVRMHGGVPNRP